MPYAVVGRPVVVGVDGSEFALGAVRWAAQEACRRGVAVRLVNAFGWSKASPVDEAVARRGCRAMLPCSIHDQLDTAAAVVEEVAPGARVERDVVEGHPVPVLRAESEGAALLVVGGRGVGGVHGLLVGSVAVSLAAHAACPVVVVRGPEQDYSSAYLPVVVGVAASVQGEAAVGFAYEAALLRGVPLVAVHTWSDRLFNSKTAPMIDWESIETGEREVLAERLAGWADKYPDVQVRRLVTGGQPARTLVEQAAHAQLLVVGSRGRGHLAGLAFGSVSHAVLHSAQCAVAVVRADAAGPA